LIGGRSNGDIKDTTGAIVTPEYPPLEIIKTNTKESFSQAILVRSKSSVSEITVEFKELVAKSKTVSSNLEHHVKWIVFKLLHMGYSQQQIIEGIILHTIKYRLRKIEGGEEIKAVLGIYDQNGVEILPERILGERVFKNETLGPITLTKTIYFGHSKGEDCTGADLYVGVKGDELTYCFYVAFDFARYLYRNIRIADSGLLIDQTDMTAPPGESYAFYETTLDKNLTNCANFSAELYDPTMLLWNKIEDSDCARVYVGENAEFPYLDARVFIEWDKDVADLGVAACLGFCSSDLTPNEDYWNTGSFGYVSLGILTSGNYEMAVWIHALKPDHINDPSVSVTLGLELIPYRNEPTNEGTVKVYGDKTTTSQTIKVEIVKEGVYCLDPEHKHSGCAMDLGTFNVSSQ
jgi:hypothetical protein